MRPAIAALLHVAAQRDAARRAALAQAGGDQRLRHRAGGEHDPARRAARAARVAVLQARADDAVAVDAAAPRSAPARASARRPRPRRGSTMSSSARRGSTASVPGTSTRPPRGPMQPTWPRALRLRPSPRRSTPSRRSARCASGIRPSPQTLSRGKACWSTSTHVEAGARQHLRAGAAGRAGADDEHVAAGRAARPGRGSCGGSRRRVPRPPGPSAAAATTAQAVIAPIRTKVSWKAASGAAGMGAQPPLEDDCRPGSMPTAPPSWRRKLIVLEPCEMRLSRQAVHRAEVERGQDEAEADAADRPPRA